ncbi:MAG: hypothetical protein V3T58_00770 [Candidatus Hydrothermarchaeales archaeon]
MNAELEEPLRLTKAFAFATIMAVTGLILLIASILLFKVKDLGRLSAPLFLAGLTLSMVGGAIGILSMLGIGMKTLKFLVKAKRK